MIKNIFLSVNGITEVQAHEALLKLAGETFCWGKKATRDMVISTITSSSAFHVSHTLIIVLCTCLLYFLDYMHSCFQPGTELNHTYVQVNV